GWVTLMNAASGKAVEVAGGSGANDATLRQMPASGATNQGFRLQPWGDYFIETSGGKYICVKNAGSTNGRPILQFTKENAFWFKWRFESAGEGFLKVASLNALYRVLCVMGGSIANGADCNLFDYDPANAGDQKVRIIPRPSGRFKFQ